MPQAYSQSEIPQPPPGPTWVDRMQAAYQREADEVALRYIDRRNDCLARAKAMLEEQKVEGVPMNRALYDALSVEAMQCHGAANRWHRHGAAILSKHETVIGLHKRPRAGGLQ